MRIASDYYSNPQNSESLFSNNKAQTNETSGSATTTTASNDTAEAKSTKTAEVRETYGLDTIKRMTDQEYAAFQRATANMSPNEKIQAAQSLHLVAKSFEEAQKMLSGGGMLAAMNGTDEGYFKSNPDMIDKGISVLRQMSSGEGKSMASFLTSYKGALSSNGLNLNA
jgi:hypothetical protein